MNIPIKNSILLNMPYDNRLFGMVIAYFLLSIGYIIMAIRKASSIFILVGMVAPLKKGAVINIPTILINNSKKNWKCIIKYSIVFCI